jgi:hypothetical protein
MIMLVLFVYCTPSLQCYLQEVRKDHICLSIYSLHT